MLVREEEVGSRVVDSSLEILPLCQEENFAFDLAKAKLSGSHGTYVNRVSDRIYYFLSGRAEVVVEGQKWQAVAGDTLVIRRGERHGLTGNAEYLVVTSPMYDPRYEHRLEE